MSGRLIRHKKSKPIDLRIFKRSYMLVNFSQVLKDPDGDDLKLDANSPALTLKEISKLSIKAVLPDDSQLSYAEKLDWARLSELISKSNEEPINVDSAKVAKLKERISKVFPSIGVAYSIEVALEGTL